MFIHNQKGTLWASFILLLVGTIFSTIGMFFAQPIGEILFWQKFGTPAQGEVLEIKELSTAVLGESLKEMVVSFKGTELVMESVPGSLIESLDSNLVAIRHNPKNESVFALDYKPAPGDINFALFHLLFGIGCLWGGGFCFFKHKKNINKYQHLQQYGQPIEGKILDIFSGNIKVQYVGYINIELEFLGQKQMIKNIHPREVEGLEIGGPISLKYNLQNPAEFVLVRA